MTTEDSLRFTDYSVPNPGVRVLFTPHHRWQRWLDVEAALALAEGQLEVIPAAAAESIAAAARLESLDPARIRAGFAATSHPLMPIVTELARVVGEPAGRWVHWGATTQNITQTGNALVLRESHGILLGLTARVLAAAARLAEREADTPMPGRTHGQHAVPITFGFKVAAWIDELARHVVRLRRCEPDLFVAMIGGAVGTFASLGAIGPKVQAAVADRLRLRPMPVPSRAIADPFAEYVCVLGLLAATAGRIAREVATLMRTEFGEVREPAGDGAIGSSTMPHKTNPKLSQDMTAIAAQLRSLVPVALEGMHHDHEVDGAYTTMMDDAVSRASVLAGDLLVRLALVLEGLHTDRDRMRANLALTRGLITSESVMLALGAAVGRQRAHEIVSAAASRAFAERRDFGAVLTEDGDVTTHLGPARLAELLDPTAHLGLSADIAREAARRAHAVVTELRHERREVNEDDPSGRGDVHG